MSGRNSWTGSPAPGTAAARFHCLSSCRRLATLPAAAAAAGSAAGLPGCLGCLPNAVAAPFFPSAGLAAAKPIKNAIPDSGVVTIRLATPKAKCETQGAGFGLQACMGQAALALLESWGGGGGVPVAAAEPPTLSPTAARVPFRTE